MRVSNQNIRKIHGLYVVTPASASLMEEVRAALDGGARVVQYRDKYSDPRTCLEKARQLRQLCRERDAVFIVNDDLDLALKVKADGLHIGKSDGRLETIRERFADGIIGVSCYNELDRAIAAEQQGADYVAFGRFFPSRTKPDAVQAAPELIEHAKKRIGIPIVAIGGINALNATRVIKAGADAVAVIDAIFSARNIQLAARAIAQKFELQEI